jgi:integrase
VRLHDLRHSFASLSLVAGADLKLISSALGHSSIAITANVYMHVAQSLQEAHAGASIRWLVKRLPVRLLKSRVHNGPTRSHLQEESP